MSEAVPLNPPGGKSSLGNGKGGIALSSRADIPANMLYVTALDVGLHVMISTFRHRLTSIIGPPIISKMTSWNIEARSSGLTSSSASSVHPYLS